MPTTVSEIQKGFFVAPYAIDGTREGVGFWDLESLSPQMINLCSNMLSAHGNASFRSKCPAPFEHLHIALTRTDTSAILTLNIHGQTIISGVLVKGADLAVDQQIFRMFIDSLRRIELIRAAATDARAFEDIAALPMRPLMIVVAWPARSITDEDQESAQQMAIHLAAAFFSGHRKHN